MIRDSCGILREARWISKSSVDQPGSRRSLRAGGFAIFRACNACGKGFWKKMKGNALIRLRDGRTRLAELHWYEAHGIGKKEFKRKAYLDEGAITSMLCADASTGVPMLASVSRAPSSSSCCSPGT